MDATSRQHKTHSRLSLNTLTHVYTQKRRSQNSTVKLTKSGALNTQYLDRLLTTDIRSAACDTLKAFAHCCYACTHIHTSSFNLSRSYTEEAMLSLCTCTQTHTHTHTHTANTTRLIFSRLMIFKTPHFFIINKLASNEYLIKLHSSTFEDFFLPGPMITPGLSRSLLDS